MFTEWYIDESYNEFTVTILIAFIVEDDAEVRMSDLLRVTEG